MLKNNKQLDENFLTMAGFSASYTFFFLFLSLMKLQKWIYKHIIVSLKSNFSNFP